MRMMILYEIYLQMQQWTLSVLGIVEGMCENARQSKHKCSLRPLRLTLTARSFLREGRSRPAFCG